MCVCVCVCKPDSVVKALLQDKNPQIANFKTLIACTDCFPSDFIILECHI